MLQPECCPVLKFPSPNKLIHFFLIRPQLQFLGHSQNVDVILGQNATRMASVPVLDRILVPL